MAWWLADLSRDGHQIAELKEQVKSGGGGGIPTTPLTPGANPTTPASVAKVRCVPPILQPQPCTPTLTYHPWAPGAGRGGLE